MVRRYKKKSFYESSKIPEATVFKVIAGYTMGQSAKSCAEKVGISRQSVQKIYTALGERVIVLLEGRFPSSNNKLGDFLNKFGDVGAFNQLVELLKSQSTEILAQYGEEITYQDFKNYRETGRMTFKGKLGEAADQASHFFRYRQLNFLLRISENNYGIREAQYPRHYAYCKLYFLVMTIMLIQIKQDSKQTGLNHADMHAALLEKVGGEDKKAKLENMLFEAKCNMTLCTLLIFSLYEHAI